MVLTHEDISIDVSITNVGLILTKLRWSALRQKSNSNLLMNIFEKKIQFLGLNGVASSREDVPIDVSISNVGAQV